MNKYTFLSGNVSAFLVEVGKNPKWLSGLHVNELDIAGKEITLYGLLPDNLHLANFPNGARLDFTYRESGEFSRYESEKVFVRFSNCRVVRCWIPELIPESPDQKQEPLEIWAVIDGDIEVMNENY